jgi:hypothetical protein
MTPDPEQPNADALPPKRHRERFIRPAGMTLDRALEIAIQAVENPTFEQIEPYPRTWNRRAAKAPEP